MSFEGFDEFLCPKGHLSQFDVYQSEPPEVCPMCQEPFVWHHLVDETNGYDPEDPSTCRAKLEVREWEDIWHNDHYGNRYATRSPLYVVPEEGRIDLVDSPVSPGRSP